MVIRVGIGFLEVFVQHIDLVPIEGFQVLLHLNLQRIQPGNMDPVRRIAQLFRPFAADVIFFAVFDVIFHGPLELLQLFRCQPFAGLGHAQGVVLSKPLYPCCNLFFQLFNG